MTPKLPDTSTSAVDSMAAPGAGKGISWNTTLTVRSETCFLSWLIWRIFAALIVAVQMPKRCCRSSS